MRLLVVSIVVFATLGACGLKDTFFQSGGPDASDQGDGGSDGPDAPPSGPPELLVSATEITVTEGQTSPFTVVLTAPPTSALLVNIEVSDDLVVGGAPAALLFSPSDWSLPQTVTLTGKSDADITDETATVTVRSPSIATPVSIAVTVDDDDALSLVLASTMLDIGEGTTGTITARLSSQPLDDIVVTITTSDSSVATISQTSFMFTPANWAIEQSLVVTGMQDANTTNGAATISFVSALLTNSSVIVQVTDDDVLGIATSTSAIAAVEGETQSFTVALTQQPLANVTVTLAAGSPGVATVGPGPLTFTTANWSTPQPVSVTALQDDDVADGATTITLAASGLSTRSVNLSVTDDDEQAISATPATDIVVGEGDTRTISVRLAFRPAADVTVTATSLDTSAAIVSPMMVTFTPGNYAAAQTITVTGVQDPDATDEATTVRLEAAAQGLVRDVSTAVDDDDTQGIELSAMTAALNEGGTATFMVRLVAQPPANTSVAISSSDLTSVTTSAASLSFTSANWNVFQPVTLTGVEDDDLVGESVTITATSSGLLARNVAVTVTDNDVQAFTTTLSAIAVTEGASTTIGVRLAYQPPANVTVAVSASGTAATAGPTPLTFTTSNWSTPQTVTVSGVQDADALNGTANLVLSASGITTAMIPITVTDDDALNIDLSPTSFTVVEGGTASLQVRLTAMPGAAVSVNLTSSDTAAATLSAASLAFSTTDWNTYKTVTVSGVQDSDAGDEVVTITATAAGVTTRTATATIDDDEVLAIQPSVASISVNEGGTAMFQVRLGAQPGGTTTVNLASSDLAAASLSATMLTFTTANWNTFQSVTVTGVQDVDVASEAVTFTLSGAGMSNATVAGTVVDDDTQAILVTPATRTVTEGTSSTVSVTLQYQPAGTYNVAVASSAPGVATVSPSTLTFTAANYQTAQVVTIVGAEDANAVENVATVSLTGAGATSGAVAVSVPDNDVLGIELEQTTLAVNEGATGTFRVRLTAQPVMTTTVALGSSDPGAATVSASLSFTTGNWNTWQTATVTGVEDPDAGNENVTISATSPGLTTRTVAVTVNDNEVQSIIITVTSVTLLDGPTGNTVDVGIRLAAAPPSDVVVGITSTAPAKVTASATSRTFTAGNYNVEQFVTLSAVADADRNFEQAAVNFTATGLATRTTNVRVNEPAILDPGTTAVTVCEGGLADFVVRLEGNPIDTLTVTATNNNARCSVTPASRAFSSGNFGTFQSFTVQGNAPGPSSITLASPTSGVTSESISIDVLSATEVVCGGPGSCGDGFCTSDESSSCSCFLDCGSCSGFCGDGICSSEEALLCNCFNDCNACF